MINPYLEEYVDSIFNCLWLDFYNANVWKL